MDVKSNYFIVELSKVSTIFGDVSAFGEGKVSKVVAELLVTTRSGEFEFGSKAYIDSSIDQFVNTLGSF